MTGNSLREQLVKYLTDAHSIEQQAPAQLKVASDIEAVAQTILADGRAAADRVHSGFDEALDGLLHADAGRR